MLYYINCFSTWYVRLLLEKKKKKKKKQVMFIPCTEYGMFKLN